MAYTDCQCYSPNAQIFFEKILKQLKADLEAWIKDLPKLKPFKGIEGFRKGFLALFEKWKKNPLSA